jgi:hypothetical protein
MPLFAVGACLVGPVMPPPLSLWRVIEAKKRDPKRTWNGIANPASKQNLGAIGLALPRPRRLGNA